MLYHCAVIGLGNIGFKFSFDPKRRKTQTHVEAYKKCRFTKLVGAVEVDPETIQFFRKTNPDIPVYKSVKDLFCSHKLDLVSICVPTKDHFSIFSEITKHNVLAIFCEKPLSHSVDESKKMVKFILKKKMLLTVNYSRRWQASYNLVKKMIADGKIGRVNAVNSFYPGRIYAVGSHLFDAIFMLTGYAPISVSASYIGRNIDPSISGWFRLKNGNNYAFANFTSTGKKEDLIFEIDVIGNRGRVRITNNGSNIEYCVFKESIRYSEYRELTMQKVKMPTEDDKFIAAISDIVNVLEGKYKRTRCSGEDALLVDRVIEKAIISAEKKGVVETIT